MSRLSSEKAAIERQLKEAQDVIATLTQERDKVRGDLARQQSEMVIMREEKRDLESQVSSLQFQVEQLEGKHEVLTRLWLRLVGVAAVGWRGHRCCCLWSLC